MIAEHEEGRAENQTLKVFFYYFNLTLRPILKLPVLLSGRKLLIIRKTEEYVFKTYREAEPHRIFLALLLALFGSKLDDNKQYPFINVSRVVIQSLRSKRRYCYRRAQENLATASIELRWRDTRNYLSLGKISKIGVREEKYGFKFAW